MVSSLDAESKEPNLNYGGIFPENTLFDDVDYSWQYWLRGKPLNQKNQWRGQLSKKLFMAAKPTSKSNSQNKRISQITVGSVIEILAPWTLKRKIQIQITEKLF